MTKKSHAHKDHKKEEETKIVDADKLDFNFKYEISKQPGGEEIKYCFQCGSCSAVCSVGAVDNQYDPRKIIRMALLGMREEVLNSEFIWLCTTCYICHEGCPQGVKIPELISAIQTIAINEGHIHPLYIESYKLLNKHGRMIEVGEFENKVRKKHKLPEIDPRPEKFRKVFKKLKIDKLASDEGEAEG